MKRTLLIILSSAGILFSQARETYLSCDFENGLPESFRYYDRDGNEPSIDTKNLGFKIGTPWVPIKTDKESNTAACSTSWYKIAGQSDDWMVTPQFTVSDDTSILRWRGMASDKDYRDGYSVYVSATGTAPEDFDMDNPLFSTKAEKQEWTTHEVSLAHFAGKTVAVAFVNNSRDKSCLYIDDIFAGVPSALEISSSVPRVMSQSGEFFVEGYVKNTSQSPIEGFTIEYSFNGGDTYTHSENTIVKPGQERIFRFISKRKINRNETLDYTLSVISGSDRSSVTGKLSSYRKINVAEEITGTWCGYCVRGIVAMAQMKEDYGEEFLGIAVHGGSDGWPDPMEMKEYGDWLLTNFNMSGYPHCTVNRSTITTGDPGNIPYYVSTYLSKENLYGLELTADVDAANRTVTARTKLFCAADVENANLRLAYAVIENDVHSTESRFWSQSNYYAGGGMGEMGGFENLPSTVPAEDMWYQDVARYFSDDFTGIAGSLPSSIYEDDICTHDYSFTLPDNIINDSNTELCVILLNSKNGTILNADRISLSGYFSGVTTVDADGALKLVCEGNTLHVNAENAVSIEIYSTDGRLVASVSSEESEIAVSTESLDGLFIVKATAGGSSVVKKFIF